MTFVQFILRLLRSAVIYSIFLITAPWLLIYVCLRRRMKRYKGAWLAETRQFPEILLDLKWGHHHHVHLKEVMLHYIVKGDPSKTLVLFLHGFPEFWYSWRHQLLEFGKEYWAVAVDLRGYGDSEKPPDSYKVNTIVEDIRQLILKLGKEQCVLVGHDYGGVVAWMLAIKYPDLVQKLGILNCPHPSAFSKVICRSPRQWLSSIHMFFMLLPFLPEYFLVSNDVDVMERIMWKTDRNRQMITAEDMEAYKYTFSSPVSFRGPLNYFRSINWLGAIGLGFKSKEHGRVMLKMPTAIIWGARDDFLTPAMGTESLKYVERSIFRVIEEGSHWVQQDYPTEVNLALHELLQME